MNNRFLACLAGLGFTLLASSPSVHAAPIKVGLVLDKGGKDDKSFNAAAYKGAKEAEKNLKIELKTVEEFTPVHFAQILTYLKLGNYPLGLLINFNSKILKNNIKTLYKFNQGNLNT